MLSYKDDMAVQIVRPATVCGFSPRLDVSVNLLTMRRTACKITVFGGDQTRPNIHIDDITDLTPFLPSDRSKSLQANPVFETS